MRSMITALLLLFLFSCKSRMPLPVPLAESPAGTEEVTVTPENVMKASLYLVGDEEKDDIDIYRNNDSILASHLHIEIIDKDLFDNKQTTAVNFWMEDAEGATKTDTVLIVKARDSILTFTDNPTDTEQHATYSYEGQLPVINQYIVLATLYEEYGYMLIDKTTGKNTATFSDLPIISPDKKFVVSVHSNIYAPMSGDINVNRFENGAIINLFTASFKNWMPQESFYGSDGWLYISVNHPKQYWTVDGEVNEEHQYIKLKIL
jgi:hypothetical protein